MGQEKLYIEKELSWLAFNERVLQEAADKSNPLIERMRFLGIYSNNLDEFYKVRFAELKRRIIISEEQGLNSHSRHLLGKIQSRVMKADQEFDGLYNELLLEMARNQIFLINERQLSRQPAELASSLFQTLSAPAHHPDPDQPRNGSGAVPERRLHLSGGRDHSWRQHQLRAAGNSVRQSAALCQPAAGNPRRRKPMILLDNILRYCLDDIFKGFFDYDALKRLLDEDDP
ncbi:polyphosphate kinase [Enterobacter cancerogenus]|uniref:Polyphosphate kinase n=1 Tax=Enterobacter cancerogenus TaxID=69218 RepID=A0A484YWW9_9ENTR|nr:polyphosphate kinase [Enterobacter cancerogenus]